MKETCFPFCVQELVEKLLKAQWLAATHEEVIEIDGLVCHKSMETETWSYSEGRKEDEIGLHVSLSH